MGSGYEMFCIVMSRPDFNPVTSRNAVIMLPWRNFLQISSSEFESTDDPEGNGISSASLALADEPR